MARTSNPRRLWELAAAAGFVCVIGCARPARTTDPFDYQGRRLAPPPRHPPPPGTSAWTPPVRAASATPAPRPQPSAQPAAAPRYPSQWTPAGGRVSDRWQTIVLHHSATVSGSARQFDQYHRNVNGWDELGYHFVVGNGTGTPDGFIEVGPRWVTQKHGAHCKTSDNYFNEHGIGICLVGNFDKRPPTPAQLRSLRYLLGYLQSQTRIPSSRILTHGGVTHKTACPGRYFPSVASLLRGGPVYASSVRAY